jgi:hypothetical protein
MGVKFSTSVFLYLMAVLKDFAIAGDINSRCFFQFFMVPHDTAINCCEAASSQPTY